MKLLRKYTVMALLLLFGATACGDLVVDNPNDPTREMALTNPGDIQSLVTSSFRDWWLSQNSYNGAMLFTSAASFQHTSMAANACMVNCSAVPRTPFINDQVDQYYPNMAYTWENIYSSLAAIADGLRSIEGDEELQAEFDADEIVTTEAFARFVQGLGHASIATIFDGGFVVTEATTIFDEDGNWQPLGEPLGYMELMDEAMAMLDEFITLAEANPNLEFNRPWIGSAAMTLGEMIPVVRSYKARFMSQVARTPEERENLDWQAIVDEAEAGLFAVGEAWEQDVPYIRTNWSTYPGGYYMGINFSAWQQVPYFVHGMADTSGNYQTWLDYPNFERNARVDLDGDGEIEPVVIQTPDLRFPQGETLAEQQNDWRTRGAGGVQLYVATGTQGHVNPARGTWRWSYYASELPYEQWITMTAPAYYINAREVRLIAAEGYYRLGREDDAAAIVDETRVDVAGLDPSADLVNDDCVPRLPNGNCGDFFEMLKWEKRHEVYGQGTLNSSWFFDSRGWGDLYYGTFLHLPIPAAEAQLLGIDDPYHTHGGGRGDFAPVSTYQWPGEGE